MNIGASIARGKSCARNIFAHACRNTMIRISPTTSQLTRPYTQPRVLVSREIYETTSLLLRLGGSSPESRDGGPGHGTAREITNSPP